MGDPHHFNADPDPAFQLYANPDPASHFNANPDPAFHLNANLDLDLDPHQSDENLRSLVYGPSRALF